MIRSIPLRTPPLLLLLALAFSGAAAVSASLADSAAICDYDAGGIAHSTASVDYDYDTAPSLANSASAAAPVSRPAFADSAEFAGTDDDLRYGYVRGPQLAEFAGFVAPESAADEIVNLYHGTSAKPIVTRLDKPRRARRVGTFSLISPEPL